MGIEIIGVTAEGPDPLDAVDLRLSVGVDVFFGRNGAGKSRILQGLGVSLGGVQPSVDGNSYLVHCRLTTGTDPSIEHAIISALNGKRSVSPLPGSGRPWEDPSVDDLRRVLARETFTQLGGHLLSRGVDAQEWLEALVWELASPGFVVLDRVGGTGGWVILVGARRQDAGPLVGSLLDALEVVDFLQPDDPDERTDESTRLDDPRLDAIWGALLDYGGFPDAARLVAHPWAVCPIFSLGESIAGPDRWADNEPLVRLIEESPNANLDDITAVKLREAVDSAAQWSEYGDEARPILVSKGGPQGVDLSRTVDALCVQIARATNHFLATFLVDAPVLVLKKSKVDEWFEKSPPLRWYARDPSGELVAVQELSAAQRRWSSLSIQLALSRIDGRRDDEADQEGLLLLDEPEDALHPTAQRFLARGLALLADEHGLQVVVASHSPALLRHEHFRLRHVRRNTEGRVEALTLPSAFVTDTSALGLDVADLIQLTRVFVVVEGRHDELVLDVTLGTELRQVAAQVLAMRGASRLSSILDARFMFDYTDARVLVVVDNAGKSQPDSLWAESCRLARNGDLDRARELLISGLDRKSDEERFLQEFGIRALETGQAARIGVYAISVPDVLDLLPVGLMAPGAVGKTWAQLRADPQAPKGSGAFKKWAAQRVAFKDDDETVIRAAESLDSLPADLIQLLTLVERLASSAW